MADLAVAVDRALHGVTGKVRKALSSTAVGLSVQLGVVGLELSQAARDRPDPVVRCARCSRSWSAAEKHPLIVVLDEFSGIERHGCRGPAPHRAATPLPGDRHRVRRLATIDHAVAVR